jgi:hypothetical protein
LLWSDIRDLILDARRTVARGVNATMVWTNFKIGRQIVEYEQGGKKRAERENEGHSPNFLRDNGIHKI